jgi:hypothetical protein
MVFVYIAILSSLQTRYLHYCTAPCLLKPQFVLRLVYCREVRVLCEVDYESLVRSSRLRHSMLVDKKE